MLNICNNCFKIKPIYCDAYHVSYKCILKIVIQYFYHIMQPKSNVYLSFLKSISIVTVSRFSMTREFSKQGAFYFLSNMTRQCFICLINFKQEVEKSRKVITGTNFSCRFSMTLNIMVKNVIFSSLIS